MEKKYDITQAIGKYMKDGEEKTQWMRIGVMLQKDDGKISIKLDALPLPNGEKNEVWLNAFEIKKKEELNDKIPF